MTRHAIKFPGAPDSTARDVFGFPKVLGSTPNVQEPSKLEPQLGVVHVKVICSNCHQGPCKGEECKVTAGGIIRPDTAEEMPSLGVVLAVGPGLISSAGIRVQPLDVKAGDRVVYDMTRIIWVDDPIRARADLPGVAFIIHHDGILAIQRLP